MDYSFELICILSQSLMLAVLVIRLGFIAKRLERLTCRVLDTMSQSSCSDFPESGIDSGNECDAPCIENTGETLPAGLVENVASDNKSSFEENPRKTNEI